MHGVRQEFRRSQQKDLKPQQSGPRGIIYDRCIDPQQTPFVYLSGQYGATLDQRILGLGIMPSTPDRAKIGSTSAEYLVCSGTSVAAL
jgi:hypothetical protein